MEGLRHLRSGWSARGMVISGLILVVVALVLLGLAPQSPAPVAALGVSMQSTAVSATPGVLPDLVVGGAANTFGPGDMWPNCIGDPNKPMGTSVWLRNVGGSDAGSFIVKVNGRDASVAGLAAGASTSVWLPVSAYSGAVVIVDVTDLVPEGNEDNNVFSGPVPIPTHPARTSCTATPVGTPPAPTSTPMPPHSLAPNLALGRPASADGQCSAAEGPEKAVDGLLTTWWCSNTANAARWVSVDLGEDLLVSSFILQHGDNSGTANAARAFTIQTSTDGVSWTTAVAVSANASATTAHSIAARPARYVRVSVTQGQQTSNTAARLRELEVYGRTGTPPPTYTPTVTATPSLTRTPTAQGGLPDLVVTSMQLLYSPCGDVAPRVEVRIANVGQGPAGSFRVRLQPPGTELSVAGLAPGAQLTLGFNTGSTSGTFTATVDSTSAVVETNEGNNQLTKTFPAQTCTMFFDNFETAKGWLVNPAGTDTATSGRWSRANPEETRDGGGVKQLGTTVSGLYSLVTGPLAGTTASSYDVDGGITSIRSPAISLYSMTPAKLTFSYSFAHGPGASADDFLRVVILSSTTRTTVFEVRGAATNRNGSWATASASLHNYMGKSIYVLIEASDSSYASLIEAQIDNLRIGS